MKKLMFLALAIVFVVGMSVSSAIAAGPYLKWDVGQDGTFDTKATLNPGETLVVDLWVTDVGPDNAPYFNVGNVDQTKPGLNYHDIFAWDGTSKPEVTVDAFWNFNPFTDITQEGWIGAWGGNLPGDTNDHKLITIKFECVKAGSDTFDFTETDEEFNLGNYSNVDTATHALTITCGEQGANHPPVAKDQSVQTVKNQSVDITLKATDADGDSLTYSIADGPTHGTLNTTNMPDVTYTPDTDYIGSDSFTFKANDGEEDSNEATVCITVKEEGDFQSITPDPNSVNARPGEEFTFSIEYDASDNDLTGLVFYVHYNSSYLEFDEVSNIFKKCYMGLTDPEDDIDDKDGNIFTDKRFLVAWADLTPPPSWPGTELPLSLMDITFHVKQWICPPLDTSINFSVKDTAQGYAFLSTPMKLHIVSFHLDIDDNGKVEALTDGLLVIRYLFGFTGEDLVDGTIGSGANRDDPDEIADWIETGILEGHLDIDDNGAVTPLTDGLLIIRYLFGFRGGDLVMGATDPGGGRISPDGIVDYIEEHLMPSS